MKTLGIDIETFSSVSLRDCGVYKYVESPDFDILLFAYAYDDEEPHVVDLASDEPLPWKVLEDLFSSDVLKTAFNANFELTCIDKWLERYTYCGGPFPKLDRKQWSCTAVLASELGLPRSLAAVGEVINLPEDQQKSKTGKALIRYFSVPCKPTKANGLRTRNLPCHDPERWETFKEYNAQDVVTERAIRRRLLKFYVDPAEHDLWVVDQAINDRGVLLDKTVAQQAVMLDSITKDDLICKAKELTGMENPKSTTQIKKWIQETTGAEIESLRKEVIPEVREASPDSVNEFLDLRASFSKTSTSKYEKMLECVCDDGRIRGLTMFCGAARTGRWAGRFVQMQNLPQNHLEDRDLDNARTLLRSGDFDTFNMMFDDTADILSQLIRTAFIPRPGCRFIVSDFSAIEARMLSWLADQEWRMEVFRTHGKIYEASAEMMFNLPPGSVTKGDPMRKRGKIAELALGYGGAVGALERMGKSTGIVLPEEELLPLVRSWRKANPAITDLWWAVDEAFRKTITTKRPQKLPHNMMVYKEGPLLRLRLPSGRALSYVKPMIVDDSITYEGVIQKSGGWGRIESYGPKIVENITQAASRDCLASVMKRLEAIGVHIVFHVHDEVICEVPNELLSDKELENFMGQAIDWCPDLPLRASAYECNYYKKD